MYHYGNEEAVGNGIRRSGIDRKELFLVTKVNFKSYDHTRETVEQSMRLLGTDYLDLVLLYWPFADYYRAWRELEALYRSGAVRAIGVSNFEPDRLVDLITYNEVKPAVDQIETHLYCHFIVSGRQITRGKKNTASRIWPMRRWDRGRRTRCLSNLSCGISPRSMASRLHRSCSGVRYRTASRSSQSPSMKRVFGRTLMCSTSA